MYRTESIYKRMGFIVMKFACRSAMSARLEYEDRVSTFMPWYIMCQQF